VREWARHVRCGAKQVKQPPQEGLLHVTGEDSTLDCEGKKKLIVKNRKRCRGNAQGSVKALDSGQVIRNGRQSTLLSKREVSLVGK